MIDIIQIAIPAGVFLLQILIGFLLFAILFRRSWGRLAVEFINRWSLLIGAAFSAIVVAGSLFYSNIMGFEPCTLCWWQRIALYPLLPIFVVAFKSNDKHVFKYVTPLAIAALTISLYQTYITFGGSPLLECGLEENCAKLYVLAYGYITIPMMATTVATLFLTLGLVQKVAQK